LNTLKSNRLELVSMGPELLKALLAGDDEQFSQKSGFNKPADLIFSTALLQMRLEQMEANPDTQPWLLRAIGIRHSHTVCGHIGFHSEPGPEDLQDVAADGVEMGYGIGENFRGKGYAKEAAYSLMRWAHERRQQRCFVLSIAPNNEASLTMARSMGFKEMGSHIDEEDGIELYFVRRLKCWPDDWNL